MYKPCLYRTIVVFSEVSAWSHFPSFSLFPNVEAVWFILWHSPLIPEGCRSSELWETSLWAILPCCILWAGKSTCVLSSPHIPRFQHVLVILMYFQEAKPGKHLAVNHGVESASWVRLQAGFYSEKKALSCICVSCCYGFIGVLENSLVHQL